MSDVVYGENAFVHVYSKKNCPSCERVKGGLVMKAVPFEVKNIDADLEAMDFIASQGHRSVPQVYVQIGDEYIHVPNPDTITNEII